MVRSIAQKKPQPLQKHDSFLGITPCFFAATIKTMLPTNHEQIDSKFSQIWQILTQKKHKGPDNPTNQFLPMITKQVWK
jgi:hypothetical protein